MTETHFTSLIISALAGSATILGLLISLWAKKIVHKFSAFVLSLASGVLLGTAFFHLLPEAHELAGDSFLVWTLAGFLFFFLTEVLVGIHACHEGEKDHSHVLGPVAGLGILIHSLLDGIAIGIGFEIDPILGLVTALAIFIHELPEGIFTFSILLHSKMTVKKASFWTALVALATPLGTLGIILMGGNLSTAILGQLLAFAAGSFLYIAASDLIPETHKSRSIPVALVLFLGILLSFGLSKITHHEENHDESSTTAGQQHDLSGDRH